MKTARRSSGFTILEVLIVLSIVVLIAGLLAPRIWFPPSLDSAVRQMSGLIRALHDQSRSTKRLYRLNFNTRTGEYWVTTIDGAVESPVTETQFRDRRSLPRDIQFQEILVGHRGRVGGGHAFMQFFPVGRVEPTVIKLKDGQELVSLLVHPVLGTVRILKGHKVLRGWKDVALHVL